MSREKQIEEMTNDLIFTSNYGTRGAVANYLINKGWSKQEWISVFDELPEMYTDVLYFDGQSIGIDFICSDGTWCDEEVHGKPITHWMPLPEAPKMKGGE